MKLMTCWKLSACCLLISLTGTGAIAQPKDNPLDKAKDALKGAAKDAKGVIQPDKKEIAPGAPNEAAIMEAWMKASTPGKMHEWLAKGCGDWDAVVKMMMPGEPSTESKATSHIEMIFDGRYQKGTFKGEMAGMPFDGISMMGFNNVTQQFEGTWMDSFSTGVMYVTGKMDGDRLVTAGEFADPMTGKMIKQRMVTTRMGEDKFVDEFFHEMDGKEVPAMTITYTRAAKAAPKPAEKTTSAADKAKEEAMKKAAEEAAKLKKQIPGNR